MCSMSLLCFLVIARSPWFQLSFIQWSSSFRFHYYLHIKKKKTQLCIFFIIHLTWLFVHFFFWIYSLLTLYVTTLFLHSIGTLGICLLLCWLNHLFFVFISWRLRISYAHCFTHFISLHNFHLYAIIYVIVLMPCLLSEYQTLVNRHLIFSSALLLSCVQLFATPWIATCQASPSIINSRVHPNSCSSSWWYHPAISSSVVPFSYRPQSLPASESFPMSQHFAWGSQSIGVPEIHLFLIYWLCQNLWLCGSQ